MLTGSVFDYHGGMAFGEPSICGCSLNQWVFLSTLGVEPF
jgi:hypothetical protein